MDVFVLVGFGDFGLDFFCGVGTKIYNVYTNVFAVFDFEINVFGDDGVVAIADNEKGRLDAEGVDLVSLALFDESGEFAAV